LAILSFQRLTSCADIRQIWLVEFKNFPRKNKKCWNISTCDFLSVFPSEKLSGTRRICYRETTHAPSGKISCPRKIFLSGNGPLIELRNSFPRHFMQF
jgi:hypothetical protein